MLENKITDCQSFTPRFRSGSHPTTLTIMTHEKTRLLAIASSGGHWVQLLRLRPAFQDCQVLYATTNSSYRHDVKGERFATIADCNRWQKLRVVWSIATIIVLLFRFRPAVVVTTGAAPGYLALRLGALAGLRTIWVDSVANAEELSMSGQMAGRHAGLWLTQWPHLSHPGGPDFKGSVL